MEVLEAPEHQVRMAKMEHRELLEPPELQDLSERVALVEQVTSIHPKLFSTYYQLFVFLNYSWSARNARSTRSAGSASRAISHHINTGSCCWSLTCNLMRLDTLELERNIFLAIQSIYLLSRKFVT